MKQKSKTDYAEVISMEEYLMKRKEIKEKEIHKGRKKSSSGKQTWAFAELYV